MPAYELSLIMRILPKPELKLALRRTAELILREGGVLRKIEHLGSRALPYRMRKDETMHSQGSFFLMFFDSPTTLIETLKDDCKRDVDIIRPRVHIIRPEPPLKCTIHEELLPPAYRPEVLGLIELAALKRKRSPKDRLRPEFNPF